MHGEVLLQVYSAYARRVKCVGIGRRLGPQAVFSLFQMFFCFRLSDSEESEPAIQGEAPGATALRYHCTRRFKLLPGLLALQCITMVASQGPLIVTLTRSPATATGFAIMASWTRSVSVLPFQVAGPGRCDFDPWRRVESTIGPQTTRCSGGALQRNRRTELAEQ